jgi:hypothetical protein
MARCRLGIPSIQPNDLPRLTVTATELGCLTIVLLIGLLLRSHGLTRGLIYDEIFTAMHFVDARSMWETVSSYLYFNNQIGYSILARLSEDVFGRHEWSLRLPALLLGMVTLPCLWIYTRQLVGPRLALGATMGLAVSPAHVAYSETARGYTGMILFSLLSTYLFFNLLARPTKIRACLYIFVNVINLYFHLYGIFVVAIQMLFVVVPGLRQTRNDAPGPSISAKAFRTLCLSFPAILLFTAILYSPVMLQFYHSVIARGTGVFDPAFGFKVIAKLSGSVGVPLQVLIVLLIAVGWEALLRRRPHEAIYFALLILLPVCLIWIIHPFDAYPRFFFYFLPFHILLVVYGISTIRGGEAQHHWAIRCLLFGTAIILSLFISENWILNSWQRLPSSGIRDAVVQVESTTGPSTVLCGIGGGAELFRYYASRPVFIPNSFDQFKQVMLGKTPMACLATPYPDDKRLSVEHEKIRKFLSAHSQSSTAREITIFSSPR